MIVRNQTRELLPVADVSSVQNGKALPCSFPLMNQENCQEAKRAAATLSLRNRELLGRQVRQSGSGGRKSERATFLPQSC